MHYTASMYTGWHALCTYCMVVYNIFTRAKINVVCKYLLYTSCPTNSLHISRPQACSSILATCGMLLIIKALGLLICVHYMDALYNYYIGRIVWMGLYQPPTCWCLLLTLHSCPCVYRPVMKVSLFACEMLHHFWQRKGSRTLALPWERLCCRRPLIENSQPDHRQKCEDVSLPFYNHYVGVCYALFTLCTHLHRPVMKVSWSHTLTHTHTPNAHTHRHTHIN